MMKRVLCNILLIAIALMITVPCAADDVTATDSVSAAVVKTQSRRRITPVKPETNVVLLPGKDVDDKLMELFLTGDTIKAMEEARRDSIKKAYTHYPLLTDLTVGFNFADLILAAAGQDHMSTDVSVTLNMWNRLQPVLELGVGRAKSTPDDMNYTYIGKLAPFGRIGANYNFTFKNIPDFQGIVGVRLGGTTFKYDIKDIHHHNSYWGEDDVTSITGQSGRALWFEVVAGLKVKIWKQLSLGWQAKFHSLLSEKQSVNGKPWYIPGYGTRNGSIAFSFSAYYTIPFNKPSTPVENESIAEPK